MPKLTVVIVNYNVKHYVEQCLHSLRKALAGVDAEVYVVDNHSHDGSVEYLQERFPEVNIIASMYNNGFAYANNVAIRQSQSEYVLLLNPDTFVAENTIQTMLRFMDEHPQAGGAGVQMLGADGQKAMESRRGLPSPMVSFYKMSGLCARFPLSKRFGKYYLSYLPWDAPARIEVISGACLMVRREVLDKTGLLDEDYFMYGEDIDLSYRILKAGYENWYLPCQILHYKGESTHKSSFRYVHVFYQAMLIFFRKHYRHMRFWVSLPIKTAIYFKAFTALLSIQTRVLRRALALRPKRKHQPAYRFFGSEFSCSTVEQMAKRKGLDVQCTVADEQTLPLGHATTIEMVTQPTVMVYDSSVYSYKTILEIMSNHPQKNVTLGLFNPETQLLITTNDIIK
jgi:group 2 glycosyl transferase